MIDFRYHIISIVAVFLALGIGILLGTTLAEPLAADIERRLGRAERTNASLQASIDELNRRLRADAAFLEAARDHLVGGALTGQRIVVMAFDGTDTSFVTGVEGSIEQAGGEVVTRIVLSREVAGPTPERAGRLAAVVGSDEDDPAAVAADALETIAAAAAGAAEGSRPRARVDDVLAGLEAAGFATVDRSGDLSAVPQGAEFALLAGAAVEPSFEAAAAHVRVAGALASAGAAVAAAEPTDSSWDVVAAMRSDPDVRNDVVTIDSADTVPGQIALVLGLDCADDGVVGHFGIGDGAEPLPQPLAGC